MIGLSEEEEEAEEKGETMEDQTDE